MEQISTDVVQRNEMFQKFGSLDVVQRQKNIRSPRQVELRGMTHAVAMSINRREQLDWYRQQKMTRSVIYYQRVGRLGKLSQQQVAVMHDDRPIMLRLTNQHQLKPDSHQPFTTRRTISPEKCAHRLQQETMNSYHIPLTFSNPCSLLREC